MQYTRSPGKKTIIQMWFNIVGAKLRKGIVNSSKNQILKYLHWFISGSSAIVRLAHYQLGLWSVHNKFRALMISLKAEVETRNLLKAFFKAEINI
jgi:hypothetical protein